MFSQKCFEHEPKHEPVRKRCSGRSKLILKAVVVLLYQNNQNKKLTFSLKCCLSLGSSSFGLVIFVSQSECMTRAFPIQSNVQNQFILLLSFIASWMRCL